MTKLIFRTIDELNRDDHSNLTPSDECLFAREYTKGEKFKAGNTNSLIANLKKSPLLRGEYQYRYKAIAIEECAGYFRNGLNPDWLSQATLVPIPPSKHKSHPEYDDRMLRVLNAISEPTPDIREIVLQRDTIRAAHESENDRPSIGELAENYQIDETVCEPAPTLIGIVDDVLTAGSHFKAMQQVLLARFPNVRTVGLFVARRVLRANDFTSFFGPTSS
jgi:predicted amidophosphoribosyltransferase